QQAIAPRTVIHSISINGAAQPTADTLHARSRDLQRVVFGFAALNFRNLRNMVYRYRLDGVDSHWIEAGTSTEAVYTNLPAGHLVFHVESIIRPDDWDMRQRVGTASMSLHLSPPFWESWPFRFAMLALFLIVFVLVQRAT